MCKNKIINALKKELLTLLGKKANQPLQIKGLDKK